MSYQIEHFSLALLNNIESDIADLGIDFGGGVRLVHNLLLPSFVTDPENMKILEEAKKSEYEYRTATFDLADMSDYALIYQFSGEVEEPFYRNYDQRKPNYLTFGASEL